MRVRKSQPSKKKLCKLPENVEVHIIDDNDDGSSKDYSAEDTSKQLVLHNPEITHDKQRVVKVTEPIDPYTSLQRSYKKPRYGYGTVLPSIGAYTVQCAYCYKWGVVPTKEKYEELRESICQELFVCARVHEWNRVLSCDDPEDMLQDGSRVWAIDKPNIVQPPPGWDREVRIRGASSKFADVYYTSPSGKKLRSLVEIGRRIHPLILSSSCCVLLMSPTHLVGLVLQSRTITCSECPNEVMHHYFDIPVDPLCRAAPTRRELLGEHGASTSDPVDFHQPVVSESPAPRPKKTTVKQVLSRKCRRTPPAATCLFEEYSGGHSNDIEHVLL